MGRLTLAASINWVSTSAGYMAGTYTSGAEAILAENGCSNDEGAYAGRELEA